MACTGCKTIGVHFIFAIFESPFCDLKRILDVVYNEQRVLPHPLWLVICVNRTPYWRGSQRHGFHSWWLQNVENKIFWTHKTIRMVRFIGVYCSPLARGRSARKVQSRTGTGWSKRRTSPTWCGVQTDWNGYSAKGGLECCGIDGRKLWTADGLTGFGPPKYE